MSSSHHDPRKIPAGRRPEHRQGCLVEERACGARGPANRASRAARSSGATTGSSSCRTTPYGVPLSSGCARALSTRTQFARAVRSRSSVVFPTPAAPRRMTRTASPARRRDRCLEHDELGLPVEQLAVRPHVAPPRPRTLGVFLGLLPVAPDAGGVTVGLMRIGVVGASGGAGRWLVDTALDRGHAVRAVVRGPIALWAERPAVELAIADVRDVTALEHAVDGATPWCGPWADATRSGRCCPASHASRRCAPTEPAHCSSR